MENGSAAGGGGAAQGGWVTFLQFKHGCRWALAAAAGVHILSCLSSFVGCSTKQLLHYNGFLYACMLAADVWLVADLNHTLLLLLLRINSSSTCCCLPARVLSLSWSPDGPRLAGSSRKESQKL
jgi:hypothetical protein